MTTSRARAPRSTGRTIVNHMLAWALVVVIPYLLVTVVVMLSNTSEGTALWFGWSALILAGPAMLAALFCLIDLGFLFWFKQAPSISLKVRTIIPAATIFILTLITPSTLIAMLVPAGPSHIFSVLTNVAWAALLGGGVYLSHRRYIADTFPQADPAGQD